MSCPAETNLRTLRVYVGAYNARGRFVATLSDAIIPGETNITNIITIPGYTNTTSVNNLGNGPSGVFSIDYAGDTTGQVLTVVYTLEQGRGQDPNVTLQAAALTAPGANNRPIATLVSPRDGTNVIAGTNVDLVATATDFDGVVTNVAFYVGGNKIGDSAAAPFTASWSNATPGVYSLTARAYDDGGAVGISSPIKVFVSGTGGLL